MAQLPALIRTADRRPSVHTARSAPAAAAAQAAALEQNLARLQRRVAELASTAASSRNWGYAGTLAQINELVLRALGEEG